MNHSTLNNVIRCVPYYPPFDFTQAMRREKQDLILSIMSSFEPIYLLLSSPASVPETPLYMNVSREMYTGGNYQSIFSTPPLYGKQD
jgi:hypothetical protein